jgi:GntR family transcriptional regulator
VTTNVDAKHVLVRRKLETEITAHLRPNELLPTERDLATRFGVSRMTIRQALRALIDEGRIYAVRGQGTFLSEPKVSKTQALTSFSDDMRARGYTPGSRLLEVSLGPAEPLTARDLGLEPGSPVYRIERVRLADSVPMCHELVHLPARLFPGLSEQDLDGSLYQLLEDRYRTRIVRADQTIRAVLVDRRRAALLGVALRSAALSVLRISTDDKGRLAERAESVYRADRYDFAASVTRAKRT